jgi:hypothetical protein
MSASSDMSISNSKASVESWPERIGSVKSNTG